MHFFSYFVSRLSCPPVSLRMLFLCSFVFLQMLFLKLFYHKLLFLMLFCLLSKALFHALLSLFRCSFLMFLGLSLYLLFLCFSVSRQLLFFLPSIRCFARPLPSAVFMQCYSQIISLSFLVGDTQLYKRLCPSVGRSIGWSVRRSVGPWTRVKK